MNKHAVKSSCFILLIIGLSFMLTSCVSSRPKGNKAPLSEPDVKEPIASTGTIAEGVKTSAENIDAATTEIEKITPIEVKPQIQPQVEAISKETNDLRDYSTDLVVLQEKLKLEQTKINELLKYAGSLEGDQAKLKDEISKLKDENNRLIKRMLAWLAAACVAGIGICIFIVFLTQNKIAIFAAIGCAVTMCIAVAVSALMTWIAYITAAVFGFLCLLAGFFVWKQILSKKTEIKNTKKESATVSKALEEVVQTGELAKKYLSPEDRHNVFGDGPEPGKADLLQSDETKLLVKQLRENKVKIAPAILFRQEK